VISFLKQGFAEVSDPLSFHKPQPGMRSETVVVIEVNVGCKFPAALSTAPLFCCFAQCPGNAPAPVFRPYENALEIEGRSVAAAIDIIGSYRYFGETGRKTPFVGGDKCAEGGRITGKPAKKFPLLLRVQIRNEFSPQAHPITIIRVLRFSDVHSCHLKTCQG